MTQQSQRMSQEELVASELNHIKYYLVTRIYNDFQPPLMQILWATDLLADSNHKSTDSEQLQHLQVIRNSVKQMVESLEILVKVIEGDHN